jgi:uncharacterized protein YbaR (Trm112 family)
MSLPADLVGLLICPLCRKPVREEGDTLHCTHEACGLRYAVKDGIPVMLIDKAERPCPGCGKTREWDGQALKCPGCGQTFTPE